MKHKIAEIEISYKPRRISKGIKITSSQIAYQILLDNWNKNTIQLYEEFKVLLLNNSNDVLGIYSLSKGGYTATLVDLRMLFATVIKSGAVGFITVHNHPSNTLKPSESDKQIFKKIKSLAKLHELNHLDNLIITEYGYFSFIDDGY